MIKRVFFPIFACALVSAQTGPWTATLRGSWVHNGAARTGDVTIASKDQTAQIVVGDAENSAVRQAAEFLAGDIEKISSHRPEIVKTPAGGRATNRLVTLGNGSMPAEVNAAGLQGQWESYRIAT